MTDDDARDVLGHLEKSAREFVAAARDALDIADEVVSERLRFLGTFFAPRTPPDADAPPKVEKIDVDPAP